MSGWPHIAVVGLMGAGKTPVGRRVAARLGRRFFDSDEELEARTGRTAASIEATEGIAAVHRREAEILLDVLRLDAPSVVAAAASTIEDDVCVSALTDAALVVWLDASVELLEPRATDRPHRPLGPDIAAELAEQAARRNPRFRRAADLVVVMDDVDVDVAADRVVRLVTSRRGRPGGAAAR